MNKNDVIDKIAEIMDSTGIDRIDSAKNGDYNLEEIDSLKIMSLFVKMENTFDIVFPDQFITIDAIKNMDALADLICNLLADIEEDKQNVI